MSHISEKEAVYRELQTLRRRCGEQRQEIKVLRQAATTKETRVWRREAKAYRAALSNIQYRLERGDLTDDLLRQILAKGLLLKGLAPWQRDAVDEAHRKDAQADGSR